LAITAAICNSYKTEALQGIHLAADVYKIALYTSAATLNKSTTAYSATNEVGNSGTYAAGGATLASRVDQVFTDTAVIDWANVSWTSATITARGALIYNSTRSNKAVAVLDFGSDITSTNGTFLITMPTPAAGTSLVRMA
jgi:hypothetical protein